VETLPAPILKELLEEKYDLYNRASFIESDPIQIPHLFSIKQDIEIAGFLTATIAWGQRISIISNARKLMGMMGSSPYEFVMEANNQQLEKLLNFVHRTFQGEDCLFFINSLRHIYMKYGGLEEAFSSGYSINQDIADSIIGFRDTFFEIECLPRTYKHVPNITKGAAAKRLNMFLRWMVRKDNRGVDFGLWKSIPPSALYLPLDLHTSNVARKLGLLARKQNDWQAVVEVISKLSKFDPIDPVKYDFALFGLGIFERFLRWLCTIIFSGLNSLRSTRNIAA
jgi:uncharacterized protein (TIGR02757 family)